MKKVLLTSATYLMPVLALAQTTGTTQNVRGALIEFRGLLALIPPILLALAIIYFMFGLGRYVLNSGNSEKRQEGIEIMLWGGIAIFVMVTITSIVRVVQNTFGLQGGGSLPAPQVQMLDSDPLA